LEPPPTETDAPPVITKAGVGGIELDGLVKKSLGFAPAAPLHGDVSGSFEALFTLWSAG